MPVTKSLQLWSDSERSAKAVEPLTFNQASKHSFWFQCEASFTGRENLNGWYWSCRPNPKLQTLGKGEIIIDWIILLTPESRFRASVTGWFALCSAHSSVPVVWLLGRGQTNHSAALVRFLVRFLSQNERIARLFRKWEELKVAQWLKWLLKMKEDSHKSATLKKAWVCRKNGASHR